MIGWRKIIYFLWIAAALVIYYNPFPELTKSLESEIFTFGTYTITSFVLFTSLTVVLFASAISSRIVSWADVCSRSSYLTFLTAVIMVLGVLTAIDIVVAVVASREPFIIAYFFNLAKVTSSG
ncbi:hypothetical protein [Methanolapillus millepedarum]|uniref:Uncharacterized protein n=1 Tax=Methanolapillus millepedarum TaxID=3028296 RepID=A0AA96ZU20_9EURY|nr:hypothetical protein MsAc7_06860 [Methanosarcinaceae archaeon Ac7]